MAILLRDLGELPIDPFEFYQERGWHILSGLFMELTSLVIRGDTVMRILLFTYMHIKSRAKWLRCICQ